MDKGNLKLELARALGEVFRAEADNLPGRVHEWLCVVQSLAGDIVSDTKEEKESFLELIEETEIAGS